jgi:hypothetical protein
MLLDQAQWDVCVDVAGNWALATEPYAIAQDAASAMRTFRREVYYNTTIGIPYFSTVLGKRPPSGLLKSYFVSASLTVPGAASAVCYLALGASRELLGQVHITTDAGQVVVANTGPGT